MVYTEVRTEGARRKYYRVLTFRKNRRVFHARRYLGSDLARGELKEKEREADARLQNPLNMLLSREERALVEQIREQHKAKHPATFENRYEVFCSEFTYDSTGIEGNTLSLRETAGLLFEAATPAKPLREIYR